MPGNLAPLQQVQDPSADQNFRQIFQAWDPGILVATALPTGVVDGQFTILQTAAMAALTPPVMWPLRYTAGVGWFPQGAVPLAAEVKPYTSLTAPDEGTSSTTYAALATAGPVITLPAAGWYDIEIGYGAYHNTAGISLAMSYDIGATGAVDADCCVSQFAVANNDVMRAHRFQPRKQFAAAVTLTAKYKTASGSATFRGPRYMSATPVLL